MLNSQANPAGMMAKPGGKAGTLLSVILAKAGIQWFT